MCRHRLKVFDMRFRLGLRVEGYRAYPEAP